MIGDQVVKGRMDTVFGTGQGYEVVDWKTGSPPSGSEVEFVAVQLPTGWPGPHSRGSLWSRSAAFHYVSAGVTVHPADLLDAAGLAVLFDRVPAVG